MERTGNEDVAVGARAAQKPGKQPLAVHQDFDRSARGRDLSRHPKGVVSRIGIYPEQTVRRW